MGRLLRSFGHAFRGLRDAFRTQPNFRIHTAGALAAIALGFACQISLAEWIAIFLCCALVLGAELINTALEAICDALHPEIHPKIRLAKDAAAAAVLVCAAASAAAAAIIFLR